MTEKETACTYMQKCITHASLASKNQSSNAYMHRTHTFWAGVLTVFHLNEVDATFAWEHPWGCLCCLGKETWRAAGLEAGAAAVETPAFPPLLTQLPERRVQHSIGWREAV